MADPSEDKKAQPQGSLFALNESAALAFSEIADLLEIKGENPFKIKAYIKASRVLRDLEQDLEELAAAGELRTIPGVGKAIADKLEAFLQTGTIPQLEELRDEIPAGLVDIAALPGLGAKKTALLHSELGVTDLETLLSALQEQRVEKVKGFSKASQGKLLAAVEKAMSSEQLFVKSRLQEWARQTAERLDGLAGLQSVHVVGTVRRKCPVGDRIELLLLCADKETASRAMFERLLESGTRHEAKDGTVRLTHPAGCPIFLHLKETSQPGWELLSSTGPAEFVERAQERGLVAVDDLGEEELFLRAGLHYLPPELRHRADCFELEPSELLKLEDIRGNLHCHTTYSDGLNTIEEMAARAAEMGHRFFAVSDHSRSLVVANGLTAERLLEQGRALERLQGEFAGLKLLASSEVDILEDGSLDFSDDVLDSLDYAVVAVHSFFHLSTEEMTERILSGLSHPKVRVLAHPTGRLLTRRDGYQADWERIFDRCAELGVAVELNASPWRLDLGEELLELAVARGCLVAINTDAHSVEECENIEHGIDIARRAGLQRERVVNTWELERLTTWLKSPKECTVSR